MSASCRPVARVLLASTLALSPLTAAAQDGPGLLDLFKPDMLVQRVLQAGIMGLRTQMDLKYQDMTVDLRLGQVTLSDVTAWPLPEWDADAECRVSFDRLTLRAAPIDRPDLFRLKAQAQGAAASAACLPPDQRAPLALLGLQQIALPRLTVDLEYDIAQAEADLHAYAQIDGVAAVDLTADLSYLWVDGRTDMEHPDPVVYLRHAALAVENLGGFEKVKGLLPPPFVDPVQAPAGVAAVVTQALAGMLGAAPGAAPDLNDAQQALIASAQAAWVAFLQNPAQLVLETGFDPGNDTFLDFNLYAEDPGAAFSALQPVVSMAPAAARRTIPVPELQQALSDDRARMDPDARRRVGTALATGLGAPRNLAQGTQILAELAEGGDGAAALTLSRVLEPRDPEGAYRWALLAGAQSQPGAASRLDRLERRLALADVLAIQSTVLGDVQHPLEALQKVSLMRDEAMARLSGIGRVRSYSVAALWAMMGAAAGDGESLDILEQIDERARLADEAGQAAWAEAEAAASDLAMQAWTGQDLPARFGGAQ